jgi:hypothetical protein
VFLGEFGYELLNWHARVRQFKRKNPSLTVMAVSRSATSILYDFCDDFFPLEQDTSFNDFAADGYFARYKDSMLNGPADLLHARELRDQVRAVVRRKAGNRDRIFVFSDTPSLVNGMDFGANRFLYGHDETHADINTFLDYSSNDYVKLRPARDTGLGKFAKDKILVMRASRARITRFNQRVSELEVIRVLADLNPVCLMEFSSARWADTTGGFRDEVPVDPVLVTSLSDQIELISASKFCLFFTEGDFRSHTYIPPLAGKDAFVLGEAALFANGDIPLWNRNVFNFGGQIRPLALETFDPSFDGSSRLTSVVSDALRN